MNIDLETLTRDELKALRRDVDKAIITVGAREWAAARDAAEQAAAALGFSLDEIVNKGPKKRGPKRSADAKPAGEPKYRNPENPAETWTGKGRQPRWFKSSIAAGTEPSLMEI